MHLHEAEQWGHTTQVHADHVAIEQLAMPAPVPEDLLMVPKFEIITKAEDELPRHLQNIRYISSYSHTIFRQEKIPRIVSARTVFAVWPHRDVELPSRKNPRM